MSATKMQRERNAARKRYKARSKDNWMLAHFGPSDLPPIPVGGERKYLTREGVIDLIRQVDYLDSMLDRFDMETQLDAATGLFAITFVLPEPEEGVA
jgi:hypothetical protein